MNIQEINKDLFTFDFLEKIDQNENFALAHCVSRDLKMGKGIAVLFKEKFGKVNELKSQNKKVGQVASLVVLKDKRPFHVFYLVTKEKYFGKPTYETFTNSIQQLSLLLKENQISNLIIPRIGTGLDKLEWEKVKTILTKELSDVNIFVYYI